MLFLFFSAILRETNKKHSMSGIREILGFHFWVDNAKRLPLEALLGDKKSVPKERMAIMRELEEEARQVIQNKSGSLGKRAGRS